MYEGNDTVSSFEDEDTSNYFLGKKPAGATNESKIDVSEIVRNIDELVVLNDEAPQEPSVAETVPRGEDVADETQMLDDRSKDELEKSEEDADLYNVSNFSI